MIERFRRGSALGLGYVLIAMAVGMRSLAQAPTWSIAGPGLFACAFMAVGFALSFLPAVRARPIWLVIFMGVVLSAVIATTSAMTGGFASPVLPAIFVVWVFASTAPLRVCAITMALELVAAVIVIRWLAPGPGSPTLFLTIAVGVAGFGLVGSLLRDQAQVRLFIAHDQLEEAHRALAEKERSLAQLNHELEQRVAAQVVEIVKRADQVEALNVQLQIKVQERSRELAAALRRLSEPAEESAPVPGQVVGNRFRIVRELGRGGMGIVYLCHDTLSRQPVALKLMHPKVSADSKLLRRFLGEAEAASAITHPGVVKPLHVDVTADGHIFQVMEYVDGLTLACRLDRGALAAPACARLGSAMAEALAAAHARGIVHRDVKPSNVILCRLPPGLRILDFGLCKMTENDPELASTAFTLSHHLMGTPAYMSPEQIRDPTTASCAADVYSMGVVLFEMVTGQLPFVRSTLQGLCLAHSQQPPPDIRPLAPTTPGELSELITRCLEKEPSGRPAASQIAARLSRLADQLNAPTALEVASYEMDGASDADSLHTTAKAHRAGHESS